MLSNLSRNLGMENKAYIDTNIFVYATLKHPDFGNDCQQILRDVNKAIFAAYGSNFVAIEILGTLAKIDAPKASKGVQSYLKSPILNLAVDARVVEFAGFITEVVNIRYDAIHAATMLLNGVNTIITNDIDHWKKLKTRFSRVVPLLEKNGLIAPVTGLIVISPADYLTWRATFHRN
jgi:predicted nucleic acid-binding protein